MLYFAGRAVAIARPVDGAAPSVTFLTTDHLGTPILAMNAAGSSIWHGGFEPFGKDFKTPSAESLGIFLRLPGQWDEPIWEEATLGAELFYNVHRWYEPAAGQYRSPDPEWLESLMLDQEAPAASGPFLYSNARPMREIDPLGLLSFEYSRGCRELSEAQRKALEEAADEAGQNASLTPACKARPREKLKIKCGSCGGNCGRQFGGTICINIGMNDSGECGDGPKCLASTILHETVHSCGADDRQSYACEKRFYGDTCRFNVPDKYKPTPECPEPCG